MPVTLTETANGGFYRDLACQNTVAHLFQLQLGFGVVAYESVVVVVS
jgi:hypothetical protein